MDCTLCNDRLRVRICTQYQNPFPLSQLLRDPLTPFPLHLSHCATSQSSLAICHCDVNETTTMTTTTTRGVRHRLSRLPVATPPSCSPPTPLWCCYCHPPLPDWRRHLSLPAICEQLKSVDGVFVFNCCCCSCCDDGHAAGDCQTRRPWTMRRLETVDCGLAAW